MKKLLLTLVSAAVLALSAATASAQADKKEKRAKKKEAMAESQSSAAMPKSVIHVVTVAFKQGTTPEQIKAVLDGVRAMPAKYPGMTHVWTKTLKVQNQKGAELPVT